jgi:hypothetical protein
VGTMRKSTKKECLKHLHLIANHGSKTVTSLLLLLLLCMPAFLCQATSKSLMFIYQWLLTGGCCKVAKQVGELALPIRSDHGEST